MTPEEWASIKRAPLGGLGEMLVAEIARENAALFPSNVRCGRVIHRDLSAGSTYCDELPVARNRLGGVWWCREHLPDVILSEDVIWRLEVQKEPWPGAGWHRLGILRVRLVPDPYPQQPATWMALNWHSSRDHLHAVGVWSWGNRETAVGCRCGIAWLSGNADTTALDRARQHVRSFRSRSATASGRGRSLAGSTHRLRKGASPERLKEYSGRSGDPTGEVRPTGAIPQVGSGAGSTPAGSPLSLLKSLLLVYRGHPGNEGGGSLHVYLDDGNIELVHLRGCMEHAETNGDPMGANLAEQIMKLTVRQRRKLHHWWCDGYRRERSVV